MKLKKNYDVDLYIIGLINQIYLLIHNLGSHKKQKHENKFRRILDDYQVTNSIFRDLEGELYDNAPYKDMLYMKLKLIEKNLEHFKNILLKEKITINDSILEQIINQINLFIFDENNLLNLKLFLDLMSSITSLYLELNTEDQKFISIQISLIFVHTLSINKGNNIEELVSFIPSCFYDAILGLGEYYLFEIMKYEDKEGLIKKQDELSKEEYLVLIYDVAFKKYHMAYQTSFLR